MDDEPGKDRPTPGAVGGRMPEPPATPSLGQEHEPQGTGVKRPPAGPADDKAADDTATDDRAGQTREPGYDEA
ncbi:hypothetical protein [Azospirillum agricola]|uniref:hypothetical protein n=1 Tax=Azospirillum agricola TaxID=1720247 RepID=UPI000A0F2E01|nr:hypothetical protein [Azospirillum agricola]SMH45815.1 hypothetical protein SAMN02982994_2295 [Azospirillum lipoferum]